MSVPRTTNGPRNLFKWSTNCSILIILSGRALGHFKCFKSLKNPAVILSRLNVFRNCHDGSTRDAADVFPFPIWHSFFKAAGLPIGPDSGPAIAIRLKRMWLVANNMLGW